MIKLTRVRGEQPQFNALFYGEPGSGKTTLAASAQDHPALKDVLFADVEGGMLSISHRGDVMKVKIKKTSDIEEVFWNLINNPKKYGRFKTLVLDSSTELQTLNLEELVAEGMKKPGGKSRTANEIYQEDYGTSTVHLKRIFRQFKDAPINVIITALAKFVYPPAVRGADMSQVEPAAVLPALTAKLSKSLMGYVDFVWYCHYDAEEEKYGMYTRQHEVIQAKTRGPLFAKKLGPYVELGPKFMMPEIYDLMCKTLSGPAVKTKKEKIDG